MLLRTLRLARVRLLEITEKKQYGSPLLDFWKRWTRVFRAALEVPLFLPTSARIYIPYPLLPNSKAEAVYKELVQAGVAAEEICAPSSNKVNALLALIWRGPGMLCMILRTRRHRTGQHPVDVYLLILWKLITQMLRQHAQLRPVIISDLSPMIHVLWGASNQLQKPPIWWQDDFHHLGELDLPVSEAVVLNHGGYLAVRKQSKDIAIYKRLVPVPQAVRLTDDFQNIGLATSAFFDAQLGQIHAVLEKISKVFEGKLLHMRLHPISRFKEADFPQKFLKIAPAHESLEDFAKRMDLVVVGNSAVQLKLLCDGVPVCHVPGLDVDGYDLYKYVQMGFVYGELKVELIDVARIIQHYSNSDAQQKLLDYIQTRSTSDVLPLVEFKSR